jgi:hypothetical protein
MKLVRWMTTAVLCCTALMSACGGGGGGGATEPVNTPPVANAGPSQNVFTRDVVKLNGAASTDANNDTLSYAWTLASKPPGSAATLTAPTTAAPSFTADVVGTYVASLVVNDGKASSSAATITVTAALDAVSVADQANAKAAKLTSTVNVSANTFKLEWLDSFAPGTSYRVETQAADGSFTSVETLASAGGANVAMQWGRAVTVSTVYRVLALPSGRAVPLQTPAGQSTVAVTIAAVAAQIQVDKAEPVSGTAQLSINASTAYLSVQWFADLRLIGNGSSAIGNGIAWDTTTQTNGSHLVLARVQTTPDTYVELRRTLSVSNANLAVTTAVTGSTLKVLATSNLGIRSVTVTLDGVPFGSLTAPNACFARNNGCSGVFDAYQFVASGAATGSHTWVATATDTAGTSRQESVTFTVSNPPTVSVTSPASDLAFVFGNLRLTGTAASDRAGAVTVTASLGDVQFLQTTALAFDKTFDLTGLPAGTYTLTVRVADSANVTTTLQRAVVVASSAALAYVPAQGLGTNGQLLTVDGDRLVYRSDEVGVRMRNFASNTDIALAAVPDTSNWSSSSGMSTASGRGADCVGRFTCVYQWAPSGSVINLSANEPVAGQYAQALLSRDAYVAWLRAGQTDGSGSRVVLFNPSQGRFFTIAPGPGAVYFLNTGLDFSVQSGVVNLFYTAATGSNGNKTTFDVYKWDSTTQASTRMTAEGEFNADPLTDGARVAWRRQLLTPPANSGATLFTENMFGGQRTTVSTSMEKFLLSDGLLAWAEITAPAVRSIKASVGGSTTQISSSTTSLLYATSGGFVVYGEGGKVYSWNNVTQKSTLRLDVAPTAVMMSGSRLFFVLGPQIYRVLLD